MKIIIRDELVNNLREKIKTLGVNEVVKLVGGVDILLKVAFNGDLKTFYEYTDYVPYKISSTGEMMYIDEMLILTLNLEDDWSKKEKKLGDFRWTSSGMNYKFTAYATPPTITNTGQVLRRVAGTCGDHGFGYSFISKRNTIGKRGKAQIFKQIIEKYKLNSYFNENNN